ncbi:C40 family peptidase [Streptomyces neyagawaensis]|uniref:C40 family peptidase n=1 Tax=Streptomyces neyagawaensis TaxID=42238 RepID=UPI0006E40984|nr:C40 family peptidase [Streptomyces neyagawaensis]MCL6738681.1 C40 family peptidase [Streptomyces neyagawaensis]MDE1686068.1 C40 family peptidase [Streptomyces neyagawaensis]
MEEPLVPLVPMSHTAHIRSHRKPRRNASSSIAVRAGVAGGILSTVAVAGASAQAVAAESVTQTLELPTLTADLATQAAQSADATQQMAADYQLQAERDAAAEAAAKQADKDLAKAKKEEARKKAAEEAERKAAAERASRDSTRTTLTTNSASTAPPASGSVETVISFLEAQLGDAYVMGATGPNAWDCSSLVQAAFKQVGVSLPRVSQDQSMQGTDIPLSQIQRGDILYWGGKGSAYHVGVYLGGGKYLDAANPSKGVVIQDLSGYPASGAVRVL